MRNFKKKVKRRDDMLVHSAGTLDDTENNDLTSEQTFTKRED
jgi:hypothetical protein